MKDSAVTTGWASAAAWDAHRPTITHLYIERGKKLSDVMSIMEREHLFFGTKRMYKSHIARWGLKKNLSTRDVPELLHQVRKQASNDPAILVVRGRQVPPKRAERYLKRTVGPLVPANQTIYSTDPYPRRLAPALRLVSLPSDMKMPDEVTLLLSQFVAGCCEGGCWCPDGTTPEFMPNPKANFWLSEINSAGYLIKQGRFRQGFIFLNVCFDQLKEILRAPDPRIFVYVYYTVLSFPENIRRRLLAYTAEMSAILLPAHHPLNHIWRVLCQAGPRQLENHAWTILHCYFDVLQQRFAHSQYGLLNFARVFHRLALNLQYITLETARSNQAEVVRGLERLGDCSNEVLHTKLAVADLYFQDAQYETAKAYLREAEREINQMQPTDPFGPKAQTEIYDMGANPWRYAPVSYHYLYFEIYKATGMVEDAVKAGRDFMRSYITRSGLRRASTMENIRSVELYFAEIGDHEEERRIHQILDSGPDLQEELQAYFRALDTAKEDSKVNISLDS